MVPAGFSCGGWSVVRFCSDKNQSLKELPGFPNNAQISTELPWSLLFYVLCSKSNKGLSNQLRKKISSCVMCPHSFYYTVSTVLCIHFIII